MPLVSISDVIDVAGEFKRPLVEGERLLEANLLVTVGRLSSSDSNIVNVWALCLKTSALTQHPHTLTVKLNLKTIYSRIMKISCDCKAGTSEKCKHCVGLLMYLNRMNSPDELEDLSCTDLTQQWGKLKKAVLTEYEAVQITKYCHFVTPQSIYAKGIPQVSEDLADQFASQILAEAPKSEIFLHRSNARERASQVNCEPVEDVEGILRENAKRITEKLLLRPRCESVQKLVDLANQELEKLSPELQQFYKENIEITPEKTVHLATSTVTQSEDGVWDAARSCRITGAKVYNAFTYTRNKNPDWEKRIKDMCNPSFDGNDATAFGLLHEPIARDCYAETKKVNVIENGIFILPDLPWLGFSADGIVVDDNFDPVKLLEIKCPPSGEKLSAAELHTSCGYFEKSKSRKLKEKQRYNGQVNLGMFLLGLEKCDFIVYSKSENNFVLDEVKLNEKFAFEMTAPLVDIYFNKILPYLFCRAETDNIFDGDGDM
ncbi:hypothetical protein FOCC_FOCC010988 [Frankliniella occidentalis]|nr:hypothetical protein FOCC_FOCC010988 [Frankliniella occidentalis]